MCSMRGQLDQIVGQGFSGNKTQLGVKMSKTVKKWVHSTSRRWLRRINFFL